MTQRIPSWSLALLAFAMLALAAGPLLAGDEALPNRAFLGVMLEGGLDTDGARVVGVTPGSGAEAAGLEKGDVIVEIDGAPITAAADVTKALRERSPGDAIGLIVERDGDEVRLDATLGEREMRGFKFAWSGEDADALEKSLRESLEGLPDKLHFGQPMKIEREPRTYLGVSLLNASEELREALGASPEAGVLVNEVVDDSPAANAGLRAGDLVVAVDGDDVSGTFELTALIRDREPGDVVLLDLVRDRAPLRLEATLGETEGTVKMFRFRSPDGDTEELGIQIDEKGMIDMGEIREEVERAMEKLRESLREVESRPRREIEVVVPGRTIAL
jgi:S1-C subfamily serine protease